jgi:hypothetical protein
MTDVQQLAELVHERNSVAMRITQLIGRPAQIGHIGEWIASKVFEIELEDSAITKGLDGWFRSGSLAGKSVNIKYYAKLEGLLAICENALPDYFLVLTGPRSTSMKSRGDARLWYIDLAFIFRASDLCSTLRASGTAKIDSCATSIRRQLWMEAEIYPASSSPILALNSTQKDMLQSFSSSGPLRI